MHKIIAVGGTFDYLHKGHKKLILTAFEKGEFVIIGITSDDFLKKINKPHDKDLIQRISQIKNFLIENGLLERARIIILEDYYGPIIKDPSIEALVVSKETLPRAEEANIIRKKLGMNEMKIYVVDYVLANNGLPISSTRIRNKEIDEEGNLIK
ncbi:MAG: pantetheine-phosphate adenylyltransferase [Candidatus Methanomethylicaceae archaeon]|nr:pantetheine-phosphate adenylyltransferase [Candidatus Verstraetearchaeota archaeon]